MPGKPSLAHSMGALYAVQIANYLVPLLTLPWLTRVLGPANFGRLGFCIAIVNYCVLLADYGFNLSATRAIALHAHDPRKRSQIFWNTLTVKALLAVAALPVLLGLTFVVAPLAELRPILLIAYLTVIGAVLTPTWFFLGMEQQSTLSRITIAARVLAVPATFLLVRSPADLPLAVAIYACTPVVVAVLCLLTLARRRLLEAAAISPSGVAAALKEGWPLFLSTASMSLYTSTNTALLGFIAGPASVGYYSAAERVTGAAQGLLGPINQTLYPRISRLMQQSPTEAFTFIRRSMRYVGAFSLAISAVLFVLAPYVVALLYGPSFESTVAVLRWLAPLPFIVGLSNVFGIQTLLPLGKKETFTRIVMLAGAINIALLLVLAGAFGAQGAAAAVLTTEVLVTLAMAISLWRLDVPIFRNHALA